MTQQRPRPQVRMCILSTLLATACEAQPAGTAPTTTPPTQEVHGMLGQQRIFFGHQSVGRNLLEGIQDLAPDALRVVEGRDATALTPGTLLHADVGRNENPGSKLEDFQKILDGGVGGQASVAMLKFCYIDFDASTDVDALFARYRSTLDALATRYPSTTFVHLTAPLTTVQSGFKATLRRTLGKPVWGERENARRAAYNARLRQELKGQPLFDLARLESTSAGGQRHVIEVDGQPVEVLAPVYTDDGGHLNAAGRRAIAAELLRFVAALPAPGVAGAPEQD